eukprot:jgi/Bigna1/87727/estExt_fgenesh1_pg.C_230145
MAVWPIFVIIQCFTELASFENSDAKKLVKEKSPPRDGPRWETELSKKETARAASGNSSSTTFSSILSRNSSALSNISSEMGTQKEVVMSALYNRVTSFWNATTEKLASLEESLVRPYGRQVTHPMSRKKKEQMGALDSEPAGATPAATTESSYRNENEDEDIGRSYGLRRAEGDNSNDDDDSDDDDDDGSGFSRIDNDEDERDDDEERFAGLPGVDQSGGGTINWQKNVTNPFSAAAANGANNAKSEEKMKKHTTNSCIGNGTGCSPSWYQYHPMLQQQKEEDGAKCFSATNKKKSNNKDASMAYEWNFGKGEEVAMDNKHVGRKHSKGEGRQKSGNPFDTKETDKNGAQKKAGCDWGARFGGDGSVSGDNNLDASSMMGSLSPSLINRRRKMMTSEGTPLLLSDGGLPALMRDDHTSQKRLVPSSCFARFSAVMAVCVILLLILTGSWIVVTKTSPTAFFSRGAEIAQNEIFSYFKSPFSPNGPAGEVISITDRGTAASSMIDDVAVGDHSSRGHSHNPHPLPTDSKVASASLNDNDVQCKSPNSRTEKPEGAVSIPFAKSHAGEILPEENTERPHPLRLTLLRAYELAVAGLLINHTRHHLWKRYRERAVRKAERSIMNADDNNHLS